MEDSCTAGCYVDFAKSAKDVATGTSYGEFFRELAEDRLQEKPLHSPAEGDYGVEMDSAVGNPVRVTAASESVKKALHSKRGGNRGGGGEKEAAARGVDEPT